MRTSTIVMIGFAVLFGLLAVFLAQTWLNNQADARLKSIEAQRKAPVPERTIVVANHNELLIRQYDALRDRHQRIAATTIAREPTRIARFIAEHREIESAIDRGNSQAAADLMTDHLRTAHELARRPPS